MKTSKLRQKKHERDAQMAKAGGKGVVFNSMHMFSDLIHNNNNNTDVEVNKKKKKKKVVRAKGQRQSAVARGRAGLVLLAGLV